MFDLHAPQPKALDKLLSLQGKTAVITGGNRGIGKQILTRFTEAGCKVCLLYTSIRADYSTGRISIQFISTIINKSLGNRFVFYKINCKLPWFAVR